MLKVIEIIPQEMGERLSLGSLNKEISEDVINNGTVYCIKNCLHPVALDRLRKELFDYYYSIEQIKINYNGPVSLKNYHSIESGVSQFQKTLHYFHGYIFNHIDELPLNLKPGIKGLFYSLICLYNELTYQDRNLIGLHADGKQFRPQIFQYPVGGGMFAAHSHSLEPQKIGLILGFSKRGRDFDNGGAGFEAPDGTIIDTSLVQDIGDIVIFRYDLKHWVAPCDIHSPLIDTEDKGRWSAVIPIY